MKTTSNAFIYLRKEQRAQLSAEYPTLKKSYLSKILHMKKNGPLADEVRKRAMELGGQLVA